ncbi:MAG: twin-arginine translocase TatA/TatE family subunit [Candidatus Krumholzibacteriia bacterium]
MGNLGWQELLVVLVIVLVIFGPKRLPEIGEALGKSMRKFRAASRDAQSEIRREVDALQKQDPDGK